MLPALVNVARSLDKEGLALVKLVGLFLHRLVVPDVGLLLALLDMRLRRLLTASAVTASMEELIWENGNFLKRSRTTTHLFSLYYSLSIQIFLNGNCALYPKPLLRKHGCRFVLIRARVFPNEKVCRLSIYTNLVLLQFSLTNHKGVPCFSSAIKKYYEHQFMSTVYERFMSKKKKKMKRVRCSVNDTHDDIDPHSRKCRVCKSSLERLCEGCDKFANYANFNIHRKACKHKQVAAATPVVAAVQKEKKVRFAFLASSWSYKKGQEPVGPLGQYCGELPAGFPKDIRRKEIEDPSGDNSFVDVYDALWGSLALDADFELVHMFHSLDDVIANAGNHHKLDLLIVGDWIYPSMGATDSAEKMHQVLQNLEMDCRGLRVFPPLEYAWYFAHKARFLTRLAKMPLHPRLVKPIPTLPVSMGHFWKPEVKEFAKEHGVEKVMLKREFSDRNRHVKEMNVSSLEALAGRDTIRWFAQPFLTEFSVNPEMRMYVIDGKCTFGCITRFVHKEEDGSSHLSTVATAPGRQTWSCAGGGKEAAAVAEHVVQIIGRDQAHALRFLRVDLVKQSNGGDGWWLNELEFFGNAHILLEVFDNAPELLELILASTKKWIKEAIINF